MFSKAKFALILFAVAQVLRYVRGGIRCSRRA